MSHLSREMAKAQSVWIQADSNSWHRRFRTVGMALVEADKLRRAAALGGQSRQWQIISKGATVTIFWLGEGAHDP